MMHTQFCCGLDLCFCLWSERWIYDDFVDLLGMENEREKGKERSIIVLPIECCVVINCE